jgi:multiple antibiotic resistance protein
MLKLSSIFILLFITLGPIKTIVPFVQLTAGADAALRRMVALRAALASTVVVLILSFIGPLILVHWGISFSAVALTGGIILFLLSLQVMMKPTESPDNESAAPETLSAAMLISRLVIPAIVTPPGIAAILALMVLSEGNQQLWLQIMGLLLLVMLVNLLTMLAARKLLAFLTVSGLRVIGWVFAVLQASLGMQVVINSLRRLGALPVQ